MNDMSVIFNFENVPVFWQGKDDKVYASFAGKIEEINAEWEAFKLIFKSHSQFATDLTTESGYEVISLVDSKEIDLFYKIYNGDKFLEHFVGVIYLGRNFVWPFSFEEFAEKVANIKVVEEQPEEEVLENE